MSLSDIGSWASIIGLGMTLLTYAMTRSVKKEVNLVLKAQIDKVYFAKRVGNIVKNLEDVRRVVEVEKMDIWISTTQYAKINSAIELVKNSWDILYAYENKLIKKCKIHSWNKQFKNIECIYGKEKYADSKEVISFLNKLITFLEKESDNGQ